MLLTQIIKALVVELCKLVAERLPHSELNLLLVYILDTRGALYCIVYSVLVRAEHCESRELARCTRCAHFHHNLCQPLCEIFATLQQNVTCLITLIRMLSRLTGYFSGVVA